MEAFKAILSGIVPHNAQESNQSHSRAEKLQQARPGRSRPRGPVGEACSGSSAASALPIDHAIDRMGGELANPRSNMILELPAVEHVRISPESSPRSNRNGNPRQELHEANPEQGKLAFTVNVCRLLSESSATSASTKSPTNQEQRRGKFECLFIKTCEETIQAKNFENKALNDETCTAKFNE